MTEEEIIKMADDKVIKYVQKVSSKEWHQMAMDWNYDSSKTFLEWVISNPQADKATILMIYWMSNPKQGFDFQDEIETNYSSGFYQNQNIEFDPKNDSGLDWTQEYPELPSNKIPLLMSNKLNGEAINSSNEYIEGIPEDIFNEIEDLYEEID